MGIISKLFGNKKQDDNKIETSGPAKLSQAISPSLHLRGKPDAYGLYPSELVMISVAEGFPVSPDYYPNYLTYDYEIANPQKMLRDLCSRGYIVVGSSIDALPRYKVTELKEIAASLGVTAKGKKSDIISALSEVGESILDPYIKDRTWKQTEIGRSALAANPYIEYFLGKHTYRVNEVGVTIWTVNEEFVMNPKRPYRDIIYRQLNNELNRAAIAFQRNPMSGNADTHKYCECLRMMGLFIEEEGRSYVNAADFYFQHIFARINIHAGLQLLKTYKLFKGQKKYQTEAIESFYDDIQIYPFLKTEILRLIDELGISNAEVRSTMMVSFARANATGIMAEAEAADFVILELSGEVEKSKALAMKCAKRAVKNL